MSLQKEEVETQTQIQEGRHVNMQTTIHGPRTKAWGRPTLRPSEGPALRDHDLGPPPPELRDSPFLWLKPPVCSTLLRQPLQTNITAHFQSFAKRNLDHMQQFSGMKLHMKIGQSQSYMLSTQNGTTGFLWHFPLFSGNLPKTLYTLRAAMLCHLQETFVF